MKIAPPDDIYEREADHVADAVVSERVANVSTGVPISLQRAPKPEITVPVKLREAGLEPGISEEKSQEKQYEEAKRRATQAFLKSDIGKQLKKDAAQRRKEFVASVEGKVVAGVSLGAALGYLLAANKKLPVPIPDVPLDFIKPGLKGKIIYEGPVRDPTKVGIKLTFKKGISIEANYQSTPGKNDKPVEHRAGLGVSIPFPLGPHDKKTEVPSRRERLAAEANRLRIEQARFRESLKSPEQRAAEQAEFLKSRLPEPASLGKESEGKLTPSPKSQIRALELNPRATGSVKKDEDDPPIQRKANAGATTPKAAPQIVHSVLASGGRPLDNDTRSFMESRFRHDFSAIRLHSDTMASESLRAVNARAYTVGHHVVFDGLQFAGHSRDGLRLLAHELTHTLQQGCAVRERVARQTDTGKPVESVPSEADATPLVDTMQQHRSSGTTLQRASKKANESKARIDRMVDDPAFAHKVWHKTSAEGKDLVLERMRKRYGPDWLDEFLTLQEGGFRGKGFENEVYVPTSVPGAPSVDELLYRGFVRVYKHRTLPDETFEIWVRPSGKQIRITRQEEAGRGATTEPQGQESTPPERETEEEANEDFSREELEELFGITIPEDFHFVRAELVSEEEGRRTIKIFYQGLFGVENLPQIMCAADDTCYVNLPLSGRNKVTQELFNVSE